MKSGKNLSIGIICILLLAIVSGCGSSGIDEADNIEKVSSSDFDVNIDETENTSLEQIEKVCNLVKNFFDTTQEYPINTDIYNAEMDKEYKVAFLEYIFNKEPMTTMYTEEMKQYPMTLFVIHLLMILELIALLLRRIL